MLCALARSRPSAASHLLLSPPPPPVGHSLHAAPVDEVQVGPGRQRHGAGVAMRLLEPADRGTAAAAAAVMRQQLSADTCNKGSCSSRHGSSRQRQQAGRFCSVNRMNCVDTYQGITPFESQPLLGYASATQQKHRLLLPAPAPDNQPQQPTVPGPGTSAATPPQSHQPQSPARPAARPWRGTGSQTQARGAACSPTCTAARSSSGCSSRQRLQARVEELHKTLPALAVTVQLRCCCTAWHNGLHLRPL
jgi:hypothetical protein